MEAGSATASGRAGWRLWAVVPVLLLAIAVGAVVTSGSSLVDLVGTNPPPADEFDIRRVEFDRGEIRITVRNPQPDDLTIANVNIDDAIVPYTVDGSTTLGRLRSSTIAVPYDWVEEDPITVGVTSSTGIETVEEIPAAIETPDPSVEGFFGYALIGALVGIVPVALGLLWLPALRQAGAVWLSAFLAIGASFATGELQLGTFLIVGFMIHNVTEGLGIAAPLARARVTILALAALALVAGAPTILGAWLGGYTTSDVLAALFFGIAAGAAFQVVVEVGRYVARQAPGGLRSGYAVGGFLPRVAPVYLNRIPA